MRKIGISLVAAATLVTWSFGGSAAEEASKAKQNKFVKPPPGFVEACDRYEWLCGNRSADDQEKKHSRLATLELVSDVNKSVNRAIRERSDMRNYGVSDYWALPYNGSGDCEDFVLMKYKKLLDAGINSKYLSIAVVITRKGENHAVLLLHHSSGDLVLDSLSPGIKPWNESPYRFLAAQSRVDKMKWELVTASSKDNVVLARR